MYAFAAETYVICGKSPDPLAYEKIISNLSCSNRYELS